MSRDWPFVGQVRVVERYVHKGTSEEVRQNHVHVCSRHLSTVIAIEILIPSKAKHCKSCLKC